MAVVIRARRNYNGRAKETGILFVKQCRRISNNIILHIIGQFSRVTFKRGNFTSLSRAFGPRLIRTSARNRIILLPETSMRRDDILFKFPFDTDSRSNSTSPYSKQKRIFQLKMLNKSSIELHYRQINK